MMRRSKPFLLLSAVLCMLFTSGFTTKKTELIFATISDVVGLSPILTNDSQSTAVNNQVYETLFARDAADYAKIIPLLADAYETPDNTTWIIRLKKGIKFHDNTPFNAEAVKFTFDRIMDPKTAAPRASILKAVKSVDVKDEYTVVLNTQAPFGAMLAALCHSNTAIVSPTAVKKQGDVNAQPVGTGPFKFVERVPGDHVTLTRFDGYWQGPAKLETIGYKVVPEISSIVAMLETGQVDFMLDIPPEQIDRLKQNPDLTVVVAPGTRINYLGFNHAVEPMDQLKVRQAFAHAIDRDAFIETLNGLGYKSQGIIGPKVFGYRPDIEQTGYDYNPEKAKALLAEAGYPKGLQLTLHTANTPVYMSMAEVIQAQVKEVGIQLDLNVMEWGAYLATTKKHEHQLFLLGWSNLTADGSELVYPNLHPENLSSSNRSNYTAGEVSEMIIASRSTTDQKKRLELLAQINKMLVEDVAMFPMYHQAVSYVHRKNVKDLLVQPNSAWFAYSAYKE